MEWDFSLTLIHEMHLYVHLETTRTLWKEELLTLDRLFTLIFKVGINFSSWLVSKPLLILNFMRFMAITNASIFYIFFQRILEVFSTFWGLLSIQGLGYLSMVGNLGACEEAHILWHLVGEWEKCVVTPPIKSSFYEEHHLS